MAPNLPRITKMTFMHADVKAGYSVHVWTDKAGELDITMTIAQYHGIHAQLADRGYAYVPTGLESAA